MATDRLINSTQGDNMITKLDGIADALDNYTSKTLQNLGMGYATSSTAAGTAAKTADLTGFNLNEGAVVSVKFTNAVGASATLNINSTGAKPIYYQGSAITANVIAAGNIATFVYSNNQYLLINVDSLTSRVSANETNISSLQQTIGDINSVLEEVL